MDRYDIAVIGSGIGGSLISALNSDKKLVLFEKDSNVGGCASCFERYGMQYNTGATTFAGFDTNQPVKRIIDKLGVNLNISKSSLAIRCVQDGKILDRKKDFESFLSHINERFPNQNNEKFWKKIYDIDRKFWELKNIYYAKYSIKSYLLTLKSLVEVMSVFGFDLFCSAQKFISKTLGDISEEYQDFIDAQLLITVQATSKEIPLLSLALGLSYPFHDVYFAYNGMGELVESILEKVEVKTNEAVQEIQKDNGLFRIKTAKGSYLAHKVILNSTIYDASKLFSDRAIENYYKSFSFHDQSAFMLYLHVKSKKEFLHHYQMIESKAFTNAISKSYFASFWKKDEETYSVTISTHTKAKFWLDLDKQEYKKQKRITQEEIQSAFMKYFELEESQIIKSFSATSKTFSRYIGRANCGGGVVSLKNLLQLPSCTTPFKGLYNIGDSVFAGQGWPGVALGVEVLHQEINR